MDFKLDHKIIQISFPQILETGTYVNIHVFIFFLIGGPKQYATHGTFVGLLFDVIYNLGILGKGCSELNYY